MKKISIDFENTADYDYETGGSGSIGEVVLFSGFKGHAEELLLLNGRTKWSSDFEIPTTPNNGNSDYFRIYPTDNRFDMISDFSFSCFSKFHSIFSSSDSFCLLFMEAQNGDFISINIGSSSNYLGIRFQIQISIDSVVKNHYSDPLNIVIGAWYHLAITRKNHNVHFFLNGKKCGQIMWSGQLANIYQVLIGTKIKKTEFVDFYRGYIDEILFDNLVCRWEDNFLIPTIPFTLSYSINHDVIRSTPENAQKLILQWSDNSFSQVELSDPLRSRLSSEIIPIPSEEYITTIISEQPNHYFPFHELSTIPTDIVANKTIDLIGNVHYNNSSDVAICSVLFDRNGYGVINNWTWRPTTSWCIEIWFRFQPHATTPINIFSMIFDNVISSVGNFVFTQTAINAFGQTITYPSGINVLDGGWHLIAVTLDHLTNTLYLNLDDKSASKAVTAAYRLNFNLGYLTIGSSLSAFRCNHLAFYDRYLPSSTSGTHYNAAKEFSDSPIWLLDTQGEIIERHTKNSLIYNPPPITRNLNLCSILSLSATGRGWGRIIENFIRINESGNSPTREITTEQVLDFSAPNNEHDGADIQKITLPNLFINIQPIQPIEIFNTKLIFLNEDRLLGIAKFDSVIPANTNLFLPELLFSPANDIYLLITDTFLGNTFTQLSKNVVNNVYLNQTNPSSIILSNSLQEKLVLTSNLSGNASVKVVDNMTEVTGICELSMPTEYYVNGSFEIRFTLDIVYPWMNLYLYFRDDSNVNQYFRLDFSSAYWPSLYVKTNTASASTSYPTIINIPYLVEIVISYDAATSTISWCMYDTKRDIKYSRTITNIVFLNFKMIFSISITNGSNSFKISNILITSFITENLLNSFSHIEVIQDFDLDFEHRYSITNSPHTSPRSIFSLQKYSPIIEFSSNITESLIHIYKQNTLDEIRGLCKATNGVLDCIPSLHSEIQPFSLMNFDNGRLFITVTTDDLDIKAADKSVSFINKFINIDFEIPTELYLTDGQSKIQQKTFEIRATVGGELINYVEADFDPYKPFVVFGIPMDGVVGGQEFNDVCGATINIDGDISLKSDVHKFKGVSAYFDGSSYLYTPYREQLNLVNYDFTVECWIYPAFNITRRIISSASTSAVWNSTTGIHWVLQLSSTSKLEFQYWNGTSMSSKSHSSTINTQEWVFVTVSKNSSHIFLSVNGIVESFDIGSIVRPSYDPYLDIGIIHTEGANMTYIFRGYMDGIRVTKYIARYIVDFEPSSKPLFDIKEYQSGQLPYSHEVFLLHNDANYGEGFIGRVKNLINDFPSCAAEGLTAIVPVQLANKPEIPFTYAPLANNSLNNYSLHHKTRYSSLFPHGSSLPLIVPDVNSNIAGALRLTNVDLNLSLTRLDITKGFTICFWLRDHIPSTNTNARIILRSNKAPVAFKFYFTPNTWRIEYLYSVSTISYTANSGSTVDFCDKWSHVAIKCSSSGAKLYRNNVECPSTYYTRPPSDVFASNLIIGDKTGAANDFTIHDFFLFEKLLSSDEISRTMNNPRYYHSDYEDDLYSGFKDFSKSTDVEINLEPAIVLNKGSLRPNALLALDYSMGSITDLDRHSSDINCAFKANGSFYVSRNFNYTCAEKYETDRLCRVYYDRLGIVKSSPKSIYVKG